MSNVLSETKKQQVIGLGRTGWSLRRIERETGVRREAGVGWAGKRKAKPAISPPIVSPDSSPPRAKPPGPPSQCEPYRESIECALTLGRNAMGIYQDLVDAHGFRGSYQAVKRFVRKLDGGAVETRAVIVTPTGEEAQVDYGSGSLLVRGPASGRYRRTRLFVLTFGYSRKSIRLLTIQSSARVWAELHEIAFRRLGGVPKILVLDNLGEGVSRPDYYDPAIYPVYRDLLAHYGATALPCRVRDPDRKGKVESGVGHAKRTPKRKPISIDGNSAGPTRAFTARLNNKWPLCLKQKSPPCSRCHWNRSVITSTASGACIRTAAAGASAAAAWPPSVSRRR